MMNCLRKSLIDVFLGVALGMSAFVAKGDSGSSAPQGQSQVFEKTVADVRSQIGQWDTSANLQGTLVITVIALGVLIAAFQATSNKWAKVAVFVMGILSAIGTGVSSSKLVFTADYRTLRQAVAQGDTIVARMDGIAATPNLSSMSPDAFAVIQQQMYAQLDKFEKIVQQVQTSGVSSTQSSRSFSDSLWNMPVVHAQSAASAPSWVSGMPADNLNLYFIGINTDTSLVKAKNNSLRDAESKLDATFELEPPYVSTDARKALIKSSYTISDTYFRSNSGNSTFTFYTLLRINRNLQRMQPFSLEYKQDGWHPADLTYDPVAGLLVLDHAGRVSRIIVDSSGIHLQQLFQVPPSSRPAAIAASPNSVFVSSNSPTGCNVYQYLFASEKLVQNNIGAGQGGCDGIAAYGSGLFLAIPVRQQIQYWQNWGTGPARSFSLPEATSNCVLKFDVIGQRLIYAGPTGTSYALSLDATKWSRLAMNLGYVNSVDTSYSHLLFASGSKVLFRSRSNNTGEDPPPSMRSLNVGLTSGVAVDSSNAAWITDYNNSSVKGPFPLN